MSETPPEDESEFEFPDAPDERPASTTVSADAAGLPDDWAEMSEEEQQAWADERERELHDQADEELRLDDDEQAALDALAEPIEDERAEVDLNGQTVQVKTYLNREMEDKLDYIEKHRDDDLDGVRKRLIEVMAWVVEDDHYGGPKGEKVYRVYAQRFGTLALAELFFETVEPAIERAEAAQRTGNLRRQT